MTQELITLQFGPTACFIGAHFWNLQEASFRFVDPSLSEAAASPTGPEADHDVLFRVGEDFRGRTTYTPRLVVCDRWSGVRVPIVNDADGIDAEPDDPASESAALANAAATVASRGLPVEVHPVDQPAERANLHQFQRRAFANAELDDVKSQATGDRRDVVDEPNYPDSSFRSWHDCLGTRLHPRSLIRLSPLVTDSAGLWRQLDEDVESRLRLFAEECDRLQGFQLLADAQDPLLGPQLSGSTLAYLAEEYPKKVRLFLPCLPDPSWLPAAEFSPTVYCFNSWLALIRSDPLASLIVPLSSPTSPTPSPWLRSSASSTSTSMSMSRHASAAVAASWLDTISLPTRLRDSIDAKPDLADVHRLLCQAGRRFCAASARLCRSDDIGEATFSPPAPIGPLFSAQFELNKSVACLSVGRALPGSAQQQQRQRFIDTVERWLSDSRAPGAGHLARHIHLTGPPLTAKSPFPIGSLLPAGPTATNSKLLGCWSMLDNCSASGDCIDSLTDIVESGGGRSSAGRTVGNLEADEFREATASARDIADRYRPDRVL